MVQLVPSFGWQKQERRIIKLLGLATSNMILNAITYSLAGSLFLSRIGTHELPLAFIILGIVSILGYGGFYQVVDRFSRPLIFRYLLWATIGLTLISYPLINLDYPLVYYLIFIGFYFQWTLLIDIMLPSLVSDYYTTLDWKRYGHFIGMAQALGGILGGGLIGILSDYFSTDRILLAVPICALIIIGQLIYLERSESPIGTKTKPKPTLSKLSTDKLKNPTQSQPSPWDSLQQFPQLLKQYPIIFFFCASVFLLVILRSLAEFQYFTAYSNHFADEQHLTQFLGWVNSLNNILQLLILYFLLRPLLAYFGVSRMNILYPLTTFASFLSLNFKFGISTAAFTHFNTISLEQSFNDSVKNLNYNAIPHRFSGEVRTLCDGLFYSLGLIVAGSLLWLAQDQLSISQITWIGLILSMVFILIGYLLGQEYLQSLLTLLRSGSVNFAEVSEGLNRLPSQSLGQIRQLLQSNPYDQILGLELAARLKHPQVVLRYIAPLFAREETRIHQALVRFLSCNDHQDITRYLGGQLVSTEPRTQLIALEALIGGQQVLTDMELRRLLRMAPLRSLQTITATSRRALHSPQLQSRLQINSTIQALVCVAAQVANSQDPEIQGACQRIWDAGLEQPIQLAVLRGIRSAGDHRLIALLEKILINGSVAVKREGFMVLAELALAGDTALATWGAQELTNPDPLVQAAVLKLLEVVQRPDLLPQITQYLAHAHLSVRLQSAMTLAAYGERSVNLVKPYLLSGRSEVVEAATTCLGKMATRQAENILFKALQSHYQRIAQVQLWLGHLRHWQGPWQHLNLGIEDYQGRLRQRVLHTLSSLDHGDTFSAVRQQLSSSDARARANAIEALSSGPHRRFVLPMVPWLEQETVLAGGPHSPLP
jgi:hypothetical protein